MTKFLGKSSWAMAVMIAALLISDGAVAQNSPQTPSPPTADEQVVGDLFRQAHTTWLEGNFAESERISREILRRDPQNALAHNNLGLALSRRGKLEEAIEQFRRSIALNPQSVHPYNGWGNVLHKQGKLQEAIALYRQAIILAPRDYYPHNGLATALHQQGKLEEAIAAYQTTISLNPSLTSAQNNLRVAQEALAVLRNQSR